MDPELVQLVASDHNLAENMVPVGRIGSAACSIESVSQLPAIVANTVEVPIADIEQVEAFVDTVAMVVAFGRGHTVVTEEASLAFVDMMASNFAETVVDSRHIVIGVEASFEVVAFCFFEFLFN